jgi:hypothetical protein
MTAVNMPTTSVYEPAQLELDGPPPKQAQVPFLIRFITAIDIELYSFGRSIVAFLHAIKIWFTVLATGQVPESSYDYVSKVIRFNTKVHGYVWGLASVKPGTDMDDDPSYSIRVHTKYQPEMKRVRVLVNPLFSIVLYIAFIPGLILGMIGLYVGWLAVLFTGNYPQWAFDKVKRLMEWGIRLSVFMMLLTDVHPEIEFM